MRPNMPPWLYLSCPAPTAGYSSLSLSLSFESLLLDIYILYNRTWTVYPGHRIHIYIWSSQGTVPSRVLAADSDILGAPLP
jgi:hypothetical protein